MMTMRWQFLAATAVSCAALSTLLAACASDDDVRIDGSEDAATPVPASDSGVVDTGADVEAGPCTDCAYFPATCGKDTLCPTGPFDSTNPAAGLDWRTRINVVRGRSASDVWLAGALGAMAHFDGTSWKTSDLGTRESQRVLWLLPAGEVSFGILERVFTRGLDVGEGEADAGVSAGGWSFRGAAPTPPESSGVLTAAWSMPASDVLWLATTTDLWRLRLTPASTFEALPGIPPSVCRAAPCRGMRSVHGSSAGTLWAVGDLGTSVRITGADGDAPVATSFDTLTWTGLAGVWAAADDDVWAVGGMGTIRHYTGDPHRWDVVSGVPTNESLNAVWGASASDVWAVGNAGVVLHYDGAAWTRVSIAGLGTRRPDLHTVWSAGAGHVFIGGDGVVLALGGKP